MVFSSVAIHNQQLGGAARHRRREGFRIDHDESSTDKHIQYQP
jgi:hypothetical protein